MQRSQKRSLLRSPCGLVCNEVVGPRIRSVALFMVIASLAPAPAPADLPVEPARGQN